MCSDRPIQPTEPIEPKAPAEPEAPDSPDTENYDHGSRYDHHTERASFSESRVVYVSTRQTNSRIEEPEESRSANKDSLLDGKDATEIRTSIRLPEGREWVFSIGFQVNITVFNFVVLDVSHGLVSQFNPDTAELFLASFTSVVSPGEGVGFGAQATAQAFATVGRGSLSSFSGDGFSVSGTAGPGSLLVLKTPDGLGGYSHESYGYAVGIGEGHSAARTQTQIHADTLERLDLNLEHHVEQWIRSYSMSPDPYLF